MQRDTNLQGDIRVGSWSELHERLFEDSWRAPLGRWRSPFAYRGNGRAGDDLTTSLGRLGSGHGDVEAHLLRNFRKYALRESRWDDSVWNWLAVAQHHGLPTRLLDWTYSPYVALHFATERLKDFNRDGAVWCVDYGKTNALLPARLRRLLSVEGSDVFTAEMLQRAASTLPAFDRLGDAFVVFFEPPSLDERIVNQFALFSLMSSPAARLDEWLLKQPGVHRRLIIPAELKWEVRDKLDQANLTERVLFPGLDGLSRWLSRYYASGPTMASSSESPSKMPSKMPSSSKMQSKKKALSTKSTLSKAPTRTAATSKASSKGRAASSKRSPRPGGRRR